MAINEKSPYITLKLDHTEPVSVDGLTNALKGYSKIYTNSLAKSPDNNFGEDLKLFIKDVRHGSVVFDLIPYLKDVQEIGSALIPIISDVKNLVEVNKTVKEALDYYSGKSNVKNPQIKNVDLLKSLERVASLPSGNHNSTMSVEVNANGATFNNCDFHINSKESQKAKKEIVKDIERLEKREDKEFTNKALTFHQLRGGEKVATVDKAIVEDLDKRPKQVTFASSLLKGKVTSSEENPLDSIFIVNLTVTKANNKTIYVITDILDTAPKNDKGFL